MIMYVHIDHHLYTTIFPCNDAAKYGITLRASLMAKQCVPINSWAPPAYLAILVTYRLHIDY